MAKKVWDDVLVNFSPSELKCKHSGGYAFHPEFATKLQLLRSLCGFPIIPTSCCRSQEYNDSLPNSSKFSLHVYDEPNRGAEGTCAIDIWEENSVRRATLLREALNLGFSFYYIGGKPSNIHLDLRTDLGELQKAW